MTTIAFHADSGYAEVLVAHEAHLQIDGLALSAGGPVLAHHEDGAWHIGSQRLTRITCQGAFRLKIEMNGSSREFGPLTELCLIGELVVSFDGPLARFYASRNAWLAEGGPVPALPLAAESQGELAAGELRGKPVAGAAVLEDRAELRSRPAANQNAPAVL